MFSECGRQRKRYHQRPRDSDGREAGSSRGQGRLFRGTPLGRGRHPMNGQERNYEYHSASDGYEEYDQGNDRGRESSNFRSRRSNRPEERDRRLSREREHQGLQPVCSDASERRSTAPHKQNGTAPEGTRKPQHWKRYEVIQLAKEGSEAVLEKVQNEEEAFLNALKFEKFLADEYVLKQLIKILYLIAINTEEAYTCRIMSQVMTACGSFLPKLRSFILEIPHLQNSFYCFKHIVKVAKFCIARIPLSSTQFPHNDLKAIGQIVLCDSKDGELIQDFQEYCKEYDIKQVELIKLQQQKRIQHSLAKQCMIDPNDDPQDKIPPQDYRECRILPKPYEINDPKYQPFLRPNVTRGAYRNSEHYLDVQFRLLREDFIGPLRDGIESLSYNRPEVTLYRRVRVLTPVCLHTGIGFQIQFDPEASHLQRVRWEHSRRLIYGSLLCLSEDNFKSTYFATIVGKRDPVQLKNGLLTVKFEGEENVFAIDPSTEFTMVESSAYFEAYRHVLEGLQQIIPDQMPFTPYIVDHYDHGPVKPPLFLKHNSNFDMNGVLDFKDSRNHRPIDVTNDYSWPAASETSLDQSQFSALKMALSQEISIIQGPPGTGKTFIGLKIVQALLLNRSVWDPSNNSPILVVCYTNHALDQFLEEILKIQLRTDCPKVVRIGGRCKNEQLKPCILANIVEVMKREWRVPKHLAGINKKNRVIMEKNQDIFETSIETIDLEEGKLLPLNELEDVIDPEHYNQLEEASDPDLVIEEWLGLVAIQDTEDKALSLALEENEHKVAVAAAGEEASSDDRLQAVEPSEEELIEVVDEPQLLEEDRKEEGEEFEMKLRNRKKDKKKKRNETKSKMKLEDGEWQVVQPSNKEKKRRIANGMSEKQMSERDVYHVDNVWKLGPKQRWSLYVNWLNKYIKNLKERLADVAEEYNTSAEECLKIKEEINLAAISDVDVVGMTTTGAAKHNHILKNLRPKVVIVEEAAEVMESHIITSLCPSVQQLVLIGDHKQLKPKPAYYPLETGYNFNISLFERLIKNDMPHTTLTTQHRMRPEIARIVGNHIYEQLDDADSVKDYDNIKGVKKNLFFIEHNERENGDASGDSWSHANTFEARYVTNLTSYLFKQGYRPDQITVLTMYRGQLIEIKQNMKKKEFGGVRVAAVDDFQGEENDIIILSLVRSNRQNRIGFLKIENRVCVALSRAKMGMYVIGDFSMLRGKEKTKWPKILEEMEVKGFLGGALPLCCQNHLEEETLAKVPEDFLKFPEGGCQKKCGHRLSCGHVCRSLCHPVDLEHQNLYKCTQICDRLLSCGHKCLSMCFQCSLKGCPPCKSPMQIILLFCGHRVVMKCSEDPRTYECKEICNKDIKCGHKCTNKCSEPCVTVCSVLTLKQLPCGHEGSVKCSDDPTRVQCNMPCEAMLDCSHKCQGTCSKCNKGRLHVHCRHKCDRNLACGHLCKFPCTANCPPCNEKCGNYCFHSRCPKKCYEPCVSCREPCKWRCDHYQCTATCGEMCNRPPCNAPCHKRIERCGHPCIGLCGEDCPKLCRTCDKEEVTEVFFGTEEEKNARFIQLKDCGHILEVSGLDQWMSQKESSGAVQFKECPKCKTPIRRSLRYGNIVKKTINDMEEIKRLNMKVLEGADLLHMPEIVETLANECVPYPSLNDLLKSVEQFLTLTKPHHLNNILTITKPHHFNTIQNKLSMLPKLLKLLKCVSSFCNTLCEFGSVQIYGSCLVAETEEIIKFMKVPFLTPQQIKDVGAEFIRVFCLARMCQFNVALVSEGKSLRDRDAQVLNDLVKRFTELGWKKPQAAESDQAIVDSSLETMRIVYRTGALTESERLNIVKAMDDIRKGAWFKCPNGHYYCIGDCGGAMEESQCPECGASIGGARHQLREDNQHASEMDQSSYPAWSEQANMNNYDFDQLM